MTLRVAKSVKESTEETCFPCAICKQDSKVNQIEDDAVPKCNPVVVLR